MKRVFAAMAVFLTGIACFAGTVRAEETVPGYSKIVGISYDETGSKPIIMSTAIYDQEGRLTKYEIKDGLKFDSYMDYVYYENNRKTATERYQDNHLSFRREFYYYD